jgi:hypothetical protein
MEYNNYGNNLSKLLDSIEMTTLEPIDNMTFGELMQLYEKMGADVKYASDIIADMKNNIENITLGSSIEGTCMLELETMKKMLEDGNIGRQETIKMIGRLNELHNEGITRKITEH